MDQCCSGNGGRKGSLRWPRGGGRTGELAEKMFKSATMDPFDPLGLNNNKARPTTLAVLVVSFIALGLMSGNAFEMGLSA